jgi:serine/threonine-protein kinase
MTAISGLFAEALRDRYNIERELGRGGMATVYLASDLKLHRPVALKVLRPDLAPSLGNERFLREIEIASRLSHPNILSLNDSGEAAGRLYYVMPYVEDESLRQRLEREGQLAVGDTIAILRGVASALTYAHERGIVHRDIKPENILLTRNASDGAVHPLVADFGIARALDMVGGERLTETGLALGTPAYMSPEQANPDARLDGRSDIYSLGCVAYEMLAGAPPFTGPTAQAILARHAVDSVLPLHTVRATLPPLVQAAIERALAKVPADRFATADEFARALVAEQGPLPLRRKLGPRRAKVTLILSAAAAAALGTMLLREAAPSVVPSAATMAILPFSAGKADTALARLGRDLAVTLSASLDGIGGIETADRLLVANATVDRGNLSQAEGATLARKLGASSFVRGTLVPAGDHVRLDLGLYRTDGQTPLAEGITVTAHRDSIGTLTDSASWSLLRQVWQRGDPPSPSLTAVTTRALPALRAFLDGERDLAANQWPQAILSYRSAIAADSTFRLAFFRYALASAWIQQPVEQEILEALGLRRDVFPERERLLVDAFLHREDSMSLTLERARQVTQRFPDYWPGWFLYGDFLAHSGAFLGHDWSEALVALQRTVSLSPNLVPGWQHIFNIALGRDQAEAARAWSRMTELGWPAMDRPRLAYRLWNEVGRTGGMLTPELETLADSLAKLAVADTTARGLELFPLRLLELGFPTAQLAFNRQALRLVTAGSDVATAYQVGNAWAWAARGQWDSALTTMREAATVHPDRVGSEGPSPALESYGLSVIGAWLGATEPEQADRNRPAAAMAASRLSDQESRQFATARLAWLDGLLGFVRRDRSAIEAARNEAVRGQYLQVPLTDRSLAALDRALVGDRKGAGRELSRIEQYWAERYGDPVVDIGVQRLITAEWLQEAGEGNKAIPLLRWQEAWQSGWWWASVGVLSAPNYLARARLEESHGEPRLARDYYRQFLRRYDRPTRWQSHLVEEATAALARLQFDP